MHNRYRQEARQEWDQVRRKVFWSKLRANLQRQPRNLLSFTEVSRSFQLKTPFNRGIQNIPLDKIVGSVGRYHDFVQAFLPATEAMGERWQTVATFYLNPVSGGLPPIEVYKVGDAYFVKDGNHRVSVANQLKLIDIEAYVWEYPEPVVGLAASRDIDTTLLETERHTFLARTQLETLHPDYDIRLTAPGGYETMLGQIVYYQYILSQIDGQEITFAEAASAWYTMFYQSTVQIIEESEVLDLFPERTPADFFIWVIQHRCELEDRYGGQILIEAVTRDLERVYRPILPLCCWRLFRGWLKRSINITLNRQQRAQPQLLEVRN